MQERGWLGCSEDEQNGEPGVANSLKGGGPKTHGELAEEAHRTLIRETSSVTFGPTLADRLTSRGWRA